MKLPHSVSDNSDGHDNVFVYGTLKRGQLRADAWPCGARQVRSAFALGELYDLGSYPAMIGGADRTAGELWTIAAQDVPETLRVLDEIEGYHNSPHDLYQRVRVDCWLMDDERQVSPISAFTYWYLNLAELSQHNRVFPVNGLCSWAR